MSWGFGQAITRDRSLVPRIVRFRIVGFDTVEVSHRRGSAQMQWGPFIDNFKVLIPSQYGGRLPQDALVWVFFYDESAAVGAVFQSRDKARHFWVYDTACYGIPKPTFSQVRKAVREFVEMEQVNDPEENEHGVRVFTREII